MTFLKAEWIKSGTLIVSIGSYQELYADAVLTCDKIVVDHIERCIHRGTLKPLFESGLIRKDDIYATRSDSSRNEKKEERRVMKL